jgi:nucleotide-binding universal stress UspA family protein
VAYKAIVVGTNGSATAERAVAEAAAVAAAHKARLVIVTAYEGAGDHYSEQAATPAEFRWVLADRNDAETHARQGRAIANEAGVSDVVVQANEGTLSDVVFDAVETFGAELIVVGSVGISGDGRKLLGGPVGDVVHHAPCDVLIVQTS